MAFLKFILVVFLLLLLIPLVRLAVAMWSIRRTLRDAQEAARRIYGEGPYRDKSSTDKDNSMPKGEYADFEELPGDLPKTGEFNDETTGSSSQVIEAEFEELP